MTNKEFFLKTLRGEMPIFIRVFKAVESTPKSKHTSYKHDPKSRTALNLLEQTFGVEAMSFPLILKTGKVDFFAMIKNGKKYKTVADIRKVFEKNMKAVEKTITKMKDADWEKRKAQMVSGKEVQWETTLNEMMWGLLLDLIHHRGQLSTYIRPMGGKVPSIYGPSADSK